jgi:hypothetical protein
VSAAPPSMGASGPRVPRGSGPHDDFFLRIGRLLRAAATREPDPADMQAMRARFIARAAGSHHRRLARIVVAALAAGAIAGGAAMLLLRAGPPLSYQVMASGAAPHGSVLHAGTLLRFSEGTELELGSDGSGWLAETSATGARLVMESGTVDARVVPRPGARWTVQAGPFLVRVTGTVFRVRWRRSQGQLDLELRHGSVVVDGPGFSQVVSAGQRLQASTRGVVQVAPLETEAAAAPPSPGDSAPPAARESWAARVARGAFASVLEETSALGLEVVLTQRGPDDLGALATAARLEGRTEVARRALGAQRRRFPSTVAGHEAAFFLGRIAEDTDGDTRAAVGFYDRYLVEAPGGALAQEALGRKLAALGRMPGAAARDQARTTARLYLARFPHGPRAAQAHRLVEE